jgi:ABC-type branched-subunit amino acid transport system substrate-binding protein
MGLANVDNAFVARTTLSQAQRCVFSGVPAATEMPTAKKYVSRYRAAFGKKPSVWGAFTYDSARILFRAIDRARSIGFAKVERALRRTRGFHGATGTITINAKTGYRKAVPVSILEVSDQKTFVLAR